MVVLASISYRSEKNSFGEEKAVCSLLKTLVTRWVFVKVSNLFFSGSGVHRLCDGCVEKGSGRQVRVSVV